MANKEEIQIKIDAAVESAEAAKSLGQLKKSLLEIQDLQAQLGEGSGPQFDKLAQASSIASSKLAETRDRIGDIQDKTRTLEGTPVERLTGSFGLLKESIMNLDFDKAKIGAEGLFNAFTPVVDGKLQTGFSGIKGALGSLGEGIKGLGSTFMSVGKALLTNPIFLLAAAIAAIVAVVIVVMDKLGILKKVIDALMIPINAVIKGFQMLTDWLGLTTHAQEEQAKAAKEAGEKQRKEIEATANKQKAYLQLTQNMTEEEAKAFAKKAGIRDEFNKSSFDIEKQRLAATNATLVNEINALEELKAAGGELTDEQKKDLEQRKTDYENNANQIKILEAQKLAAIENMNKNTTANLEAWQIKNIANKNERDKAQLKVEEANEIRKIDIQIAEAKRLGADYSKLEATKNEIRKFYANSEKEINKAVAAQNATIAKEARDKKEAAAIKELKDLEDKNTLAIKMTKENTAERLKAEQDAIDAVLKFQKEKQKILKISDTQIKILEKDAADRKEQLEKEYLGLVDKRTKEEVLLEKQAAVDKAKTAEELYIAKRDLVKTTAEFEIKEAGDNEAKKTAISAKAGADISAMDQEFFMEEKERLALIAETKAKNLEIDLQQEGLSFAEKKTKLEELAQARLDQAGLEREAALSDTNLTEAQKEAIEADYRSKKLDAEKELHDAKVALLQEEFDKAAEYGEKGVAVAQGFSDAIFAFKKNNIDKEMKANMEGLKSGTKEYDKAAMENFKIAQNLARKQFNTNKALQLSSAVIDGFKAITSSLSQSPIALGPVPNPAGIASLAFAAATTVANIAKIAASKFQEGTPPAPTVPQPNAGGEGGEGGGAPTNFSPNQFFGLGQQTAQGLPGGPKPMKVYVVESDITSTQNQVKVIENRAVLGP